MNIVVLGAGAWGTALASSLAQYRADHRVTLWGRDADLMQEMAKARLNQTYLPDVALSDLLLMTSDLESVLTEHASAQDLIIVATPMSALRGMCTRIAQHGGNAPVLWLCKGVERETALFPHQIVQSTLGAQRAYGALSGPSFAQEVAQGKPCALTLASTSEQLDDAFASQLHHAWLRIYTSRDVTGVEIGGALKNVLAIAAGVSDGLDLGLNARAALLTRGVTEMQRLGQALGAQASTLTGLTGLGDLMLTATGNLSRNRAVGLSLAQGRSLDEITAQLGHVAEGVLCAHAIRALAQQHEVDMPITEAVCDLLDGLSPMQAVQKLMSREQTRES